MARSALRAGSGLLRARLGGVPRPLWVIADLTARCDQRCAYCAKSQVDSEDIPTAVWLDFVDQCRAAGTVRLGLHGGEPLLHEGVGRIVARARRQDLFVHLYSNGRRVAERIGELTDLDLLLISLDGAPQEHDRLRGRGSHERVLRSLAAARGRVPVGVITTLTAHNRHAVQDVLALAEQRGFSVVFQAYAVTPDAADCPALAPEELVQAVRAIRAAKRRGAPVSNSYTALRLMEAHAAAYPGAHSIYAADARCWAGRSFCDVAADGGVFPCFESPDRETHALDFRQVGFQAAFDHLAGFRCSSCRSLCGLDTNLLLSLSPEAVGNALRALASGESAVRRRGDG